MSEFSLYIRLGQEHILDYRNGYDHILFVVALCAIYLVRDWKSILILITAFTVGHSITLALATLQVIQINAQKIELLIPLTIFITAVSNLFRKEQIAQHSKIQFNYFFALFFGLIHGLGFSNYLRAILGKNHHIVWQLLGFNIGLEIGQLIVVAIFLFIAFLLVDLLKVNRRDWKIILSSAIAGIALILLKNTFE